LEEECEEIICNVNKRPVGNGNRSFQNRNSFGQNQNFNGPYRNNYSENRSGDGSTNINNGGKDKKEDDEVNKINSKLVEMGKTLTEIQKWIKNMDGTKNDGSKVDDKVKIVSDGGSTNVQCYKCQEFGHIIRNCPQFVPKEILGN
jgi:hypothetical protein